MNRDEDNSTQPAAEKTPEEKAEDWKWKAELEKQLKRQEAQPDRELEGIFRAFAVPLSGRGLSILIFGSLLIRLGDLLPLVGMLVPLLVYSYVLDVIAAAAYGRDQLPPWRMEDLWEEAWKGIKFVGLVLFAFLPAMIFFFSLFDFGLSGSGWFKISGSWIGVGFILLFLAGTFCLPTMLLIGAISGSFIKALNPRAIVEVIRKVFWPYLLVFLLCLLSVAGIIIANQILGRILSGRSIPIRLLATFLSTGLSFYSLLVMGFMVGRFFYCEEAELF